MDEIRDPQYKSPDGSALRIWRDTAKNNYQSEQEGRPIFDECIYVECISPGSRDSTPVFECVRHFSKESANFGKPLLGQKYEEYKSFILDFEKNEQADSSMAGTPLAQWPEMTRTMVASLKAQNIFTVEALANLPDQKLIVVGPDGRTWREKAKAYMENAKSGAYATELAAKLETAKLENAALQDQIKELAASVQTLQDQVNGRPGAAPAPAAKAAKAAAKVAQAASSVEAEAEVDPITGEPLAPLSGERPVPADII